MWGRAGAISSAVGKVVREILSEVTYQQRSGKENEGVIFWTRDLQTEATAQVSGPVTEQVASTQSDWGGVEGAEVR